MAVALAALDATVARRGPGGPRAIPFADLHRLPGDEPQRDTVLEPGELITAVELPALPIAARSRYRKVRDRASFAFALVSVAAALDVARRRARRAGSRSAAWPTCPWRAHARRGGAARRVRRPRRPSRRPRTPSSPRPTRCRDNAFKVPLARASSSRTLAELAG